MFNSFNLENLADGNPSYERSIENKRSIKMVAGRCLEIVISLVTFEKT